MRKIKLFILPLLTLSLCISCGLSKEEKQQQAIEKFNDERQKRIVDTYDQFDFNIVRWGEFPLYYNEETGKIDDHDEVTEKFIAEYNPYYGYWLDERSFNQNITIFTKEQLAQLGYSASDSEVYWFSIITGEYCNMGVINSSGYLFPEDIWEEVHNNPYIDLTTDKHVIPDVVAIWESLNSEIQVSEETNTPIVEENIENIENTTAIKRGNKISTSYGYVFWQDISDTDVLIFSDERMDIWVSKIEKKPSEYYGNFVFAVYGTIINHSGEDYQSVALNFTVLKDQNVIDDMQAGFCSIGGYQLKDYFMDAQEREFTCDILANEYSYEYGNEIGLTGITTFGYSTGGTTQYEASSSSDAESSNSTYVEDFILPNSSTQILDESNLVGLSAQQLTYARNEIYARHGYIFDSQELNDYFAEKSWYHSNPNYDGTLNDIERQNAIFIKEYQENNGLTYKPQ